MLVYAALLLGFVVGVVSFVESFGTTAEGGNLVAPHKDLLLGVYAVYLLILVGATGVRFYRQRPGRTAQL